MTFAPPWMVALPGLGFVQALELTQASTALSIAVPGGPAAGMASSYGMLQRWGFAARDDHAGGHADRALEPVPEPLLPDPGRLPLTSRASEQTALLATAASSASPCSAS